jgi:hypothetical protein
MLLLDTKDSSDFDSKALARSNALQEFNTREI